MPQNIFVQWLARFIALTVRIIIRCRYRIVVHGSEILKRGKPSLILPNHMALVDPIILLSQLYHYAPATPVISEKYFDIPIARSFFKSLGAVRVSDLERGSRDTQVLKVITRSVLKGLGRGNNILLYPSGQIAAQGYEKIFNKKSAHQIVGKLPGNVQVVGVRITGLWGSMFSKAGRGASPNFFLLLFKGAFILVANLILFVPRRRVTIELEDITIPAEAMAQEGQKPFNQFLESFYNLHGEEVPNPQKHFFYFPPFR